jgi:hypothetical protein
MRSEHRDGTGGLRSVTVGGALLALAAVLAPAACSERPPPAPGENGRLEQAKWHDLRDSRLVTAPLAPGAPHTERLDNGASESNSAVATVFAQVPATTDPTVAFRAAFDRLGRAGVTFRQLDCTGDAGGPVNATGQASVPASWDDVPTWPAVVSLGLVTDGEPFASVAPPYLRIDVTIGAGTPVQIGQGEVPRRLVGTCPSGIALP